MAIGCPTIVSDIPAIREVCGEASAYFDPLDPDHIASVLLDVLHDPARQEQLRRRGFDQAARYDWDRSAMQFIHAMETILRRAPARWQSSP